MSDVLIKALEEYALEKAGEGSRGGKIIGHAPSGRPIYQGANGSTSAWPQNEKAHKVTLEYSHNGVRGEHTLDNVMGHHHGHVHEKVVNAIPALEKKHPGMKFHRIKIQSRKDEPVKKAQIMTNVIGTNLNTNEASIDEMALEHEPWLAKLQEMSVEMKTLEPQKSIMIGDKELSLQKEDEGLFSAYVREADPKSGDLGAILMKLQKTGIPSIVAALKIKGWLPEPEMEESVHDVPQLSAEENKDANLFEQIEDLVNHHEEEWEDLDGTPAEQSEDARMLELVRMLLGFKKSLEIDGLKEILSKVSPLK